MSDMPLLTAHDVARRLNVSKRVVYRLAARQEIGSVPVAGKVNFKPEHVDEYIARQERPAVVAPQPPAAPVIDPKRFELPVIRKRRLS
jgi:excisionase family DNA binding protein